MVALDRMMPVVLVSVLAMCLVVFEVQSEDSTCVASIYKAMLAKKQPSNPKLGILAGNDWWFLWQTSSHAASATKKYVKFGELSGEEVQVEFFLESDGVTNSAKLTYQEQDDNFVYVKELNDCLYCFDCGDGIYALYNCKKDNGSGSDPEFVVLVNRDMNKDDAKDKGNSCLNKIKTIDEAKNLKFTELEYPY